MKLYSDILTINDLHRAAEDIPAVYVKPYATVVHKRTRRLEGVNLFAISAERPKNWRELDESANRGTIQGHRSMPQHATYNEHGRWMACLFDMDPELRIVSAVTDYEGRDSFHRQTHGRFLTARCSHCGGMAELCEACPHDEGDVICANPSCAFHGEHVCNSFA